MNGIIEATNTIAAYSNAVLTLLLPRIIDTAHRLDLPEQNATMSEVRYCYPAQDLRAYAERAVLEAEGSASAGELPSTAAGTVGFKTGNKYTFDFGYVVSFETRHVFYGTEDLRRLARMYGKFVLTEAEAIAVARRAITKLGYSQKAMYTDLQPIVTVPGRSGTEVTPRFLIEWPKPNECYSPSAQFEINGETGAIECFFILNDTLFEPAPPIPGRKPAKGYHPELPESEARTLLPACFAPLGAFASRLKLPVALPITTNSVEKFAFYRDQRTVADITLTNGYFFKLFGLTPVEFNAPDVFLVPITLL